MDNGLTMNKQIYASDIYHNVSMQMIYYDIYQIYHLYIIYNIYHNIYRSSNIKWPSWKHRSRTPSQSYVLPISFWAHGAPRVQETCWSGLVWDEGLKYRYLTSSESQLVVLFLLQVSKVSPFALLSTAPDHAPTGSLIDRAW